MKFINSSYDPDTGISKVTMQHLGKKFLGIAKLNPDAKETASEFAGCYYAEIRAKINALKYERNKAKEEAEICRKFVKSIECYSKFNAKEDSAKSIYRQLNRRIKKVNDLAYQINNLLIHLDKSIHDRNIVLKAFEKRKTKQDNL